MDIRHQRGCEYIKELQRSLESGWRDCFEEKDKSITLRLALLHPDHYQRLRDKRAPEAATLQREIQGRRQFPREGSCGKCESELLWGYACPLNSPQIEQDHLFPYSLGGPTNHKNRIVLCRYHNMVKAADVHRLPWEGAANRIEPWLDAQLEVLHRKIRNYL